MREYPELLPSHEGKIENNCLHIFAQVLFQHNYLLFQVFQCYKTLKLFKRCENFEIFQCFEGNMTGDATAWIRKNFNHLLSIGLQLFLINIWKVLTMDRKFRESIWLTFMKTCLANSITKILWKGLILQDRSSIQQLSNLVMIQMVGSSDSELWLVDQKCEHNHIEYAQKLIL